MGPLLALTFALMVVGLLGSVRPGLPGVTLIFLSALLYAILTDFRTIGVVILVVLFVFAAIALVADFVATSYGARRFEAGNWATGIRFKGGLVAWRPRRQSAPCGWRGPADRPLTAET